MADPTSKNFLRILVDPKDALVEYARSKTTFPVTVDRVQANHRSDIYSIVAVHGLNPFNTEFHAEKTWSARDGQGGEVLWLRDFLPQQLPTARVLLFGYNSNVAFETSILGVREQAENLLNRLKLKRRGAPNRPIVFVAHSLGGIVVKRALIETKINPTYEATGTSTYGLVFFGTPHRGGNNARLGDIAATLTRAVRQDVTNSFMESLKKDTLFSNELIEDFKHQLEDRHILSFYETKPYKTRGLKLDLIVDKKSATLGLPGTREVSIGLDSDHDGICKFSSVTDDMYEQVSGNIVELVKRAIEDAAVRQKITNLTLPATNPHHGGEHCTSYPLDIAEEQLLVAKEQLQAQKDLVKKRLSEEEKKCHQLFRLTNNDRDTTYELYKDRVAERIDGTCMWLLKHDHFQAWLAQESGPLLVTADPGCGKSVLAKYLVDHGLPRSSTICYFFFHDHDQDTVRQALCALLHQLFDQQPSLIKHALPHYNKDGKGLVHSTRSLWEVFQSAIQNSQTGPIIVVLDALDECAEKEFEDLMRNIKGQISNGQSGTKLKYLLTSRPYDQITSKFWDLLHTFPNIRIPGEEESETISEEVNRVIAYRVSRLPTQDPAKDRMEGFSPEIKEHLERKLQETTNRTYLWVYLVFDYLEKESFKKTISGVNSAIAKLPKSINEAYEQILSKSKDHSTVRKVLCIVLAATRPLELSEMNIAINVEDPQSFDDLDLEDEQDFKMRLRSLCGLFISVHQSKVYFLHQTARDFLLTNEVLPTTIPSAPHWYSITESQAHAVLAKVCVLYLHLLDSDVRLLKDESERKTDSDRRYDFLYYSAHRWSDHFHVANISEGDAIMPFALRICDPHSRCFLVWFKTYCNFRIQEVTDATHLTVVSKLGHVALVRRLLAEEVGIEARDSVNGSTPLLWAAKHNHKAVFKLLLDHGADIEARDNRGQTPLLCAVNQGSLNIIELLLERGANIKARNYSGETALSLAAGRGSRLLVSLLLNANADSEARDKSGQTPLFAAVQRSCVSVVRLLLEEGVNVEARDNRGKTPLSRAAMCGNTAVIKLLLDKNADPEARDDWRRTPLWWAVASRWSSPAPVKLLLDEGANVRARDKSGRTPLSQAAEEGNTAIIKLLLDKNADPEAMDDRRRTPLWWAVVGEGPRGSRGAIKLLLEAGSNIETTDRLGRTPLSRAAGLGNMHSVNMLLAKGADPEARDRLHRTPIWWAARRRNLAVVGLLLEKGAKLEAPSKVGLRRFWRSSGEVVMSLLLREPANLFFTNANPYASTLNAALLLWAVRCGRRVEVKQLLENGADVEARDRKNGNAALSCAAAIGDVALVTLLLGRGAKIEARDNSGKTALSWAARRGHEDVAKILLVSGADKQSKDETGRTPLLWATWHGHDSLFQLLRE